MPRDVLAINAGSRSLKLAVIRFDEGNEHEVARVLVDGIHDAPNLHLTVGAERFERSLPSPSQEPYAEAVQAALTDLDRHVEDLDVVAVAHRVVHGGRLRQPVRLDDGVIAEIEAARELAPLHNEPALACIRATRQLWDHLAQAAVFDTGFHETMPERASRYAIDPALSDRNRVRRYGFHGLAHESMAIGAAEAMAKRLADLRLVTVQLGGGCSAAAIDGGRSIDTTMGMTPLEGLMMATRSGDVDPSLTGYLARREGVEVETVERWLNRESGLLGVSGHSSDVRELLAVEATEPGAALALEMYCYRIRKQIGAYLAALGGADAVVLGGGVAEHQSSIRARTLQGMQWAGLILDEQRNEALTNVLAEPVRISADDSRIAAWVVPVDEERLLARHALTCLFPEAG